jgi:3-dehydroquinate synthase
MGLLADGEDARICALLEKLGFRLWHPLLEKRNEDGGLAVLGGLREFREHLGGELTITLLRDIGIGEEVHEMHEGEIRKAIAWLKHRLERR